MITRFELISDERGRVMFCLLDGSGEVLLQGLPCRGKIDAQTEVFHTRQSLRAADHLVPHRSGEGRHFVVLKDDDGTVLAKSRHVDSADELGTLIGEIVATGSEAPVIDRTRRAARR